MRIGIVTESFPPEVNGVAHSVLRVAEHLVARGHQPLVIAPRPATGSPAEPQHGFPVVRVRSVPFPGYRSVRLGLASPAIQRALFGHRAELVHLASPFFLGAFGSRSARRLRLMPSAVFLGQRRGEQLARIFASLDVFVHGGCHETFGQTIQEAAASGLPVVAPAVGGPADLVDDGVTGCLVPPGDAGALTAATRRLAADPLARAAMGRAARQRVLARSWAALGDQLIGHYAAVLGEPGSWLAGQLSGDQRDAVPPCDLLAGGQVGRARLGVVDLR